MYYSNKSHFLNGLELHVEISDGSAGLITGLEYWNGLLDWIFLVSHIKGGVTVHVATFHH